MTLERRARPEPEPLDVRVIYEDESVIVADKPPGLIVHPTYRNWSGTLLNGLLWHVRDRPGVRPSVITRLDRDTSGLVLCAVTPEVQAAIQKDINGRRLNKEYLAIVRGQPSPASGVIELPLARSKEDRRLVVVDEAGARCETRYAVMASDASQSLVRCELITGRTHQIRVHLAASGWPILGDATYGVADPRIARQALHAWRLSLPHPVTRERLTFTSEMPGDMRQLLPPGRL